MESKTTELKEADWNGGNQGLGGGSKGEMLVKDYNLPVRS